MEDAEISIREEGSPKVAQLCNPSCRPLLIRLEGLERHRVLRWLNCRTSKYPRSPDESFNRFLRIFFVLVLSLGVIKILFELSMTYVAGKMWLIYLFGWSSIIVLVMLVAEAAPIVKKKMKNVGFTPPRKEEVKTISGLIQQV